MAVSIYAWEPSGLVGEVIDAPARQFHRARGCAHCRNTGYQGRIALYELLTMNTEIRDGITQGLNASHLRQIALKSGMRSLKYDGLAKVHQGSLPQLPLPPRLRFRMAIPRRPA